MQNNLKLSVLIITGFLCVCGSECSPADEVEISASERLKNDQEAVSGRYATFERLLSQMADMMGHEDPERSELLRRAISKGREHSIATELDAIAKSLGESHFGESLERQVGVTKSLELLLKLLQSEDRRSSVEKDAERLDNILKNVKNTITAEKAARGSARNSNAPSNAAPAQKKALDKTDEILKGIKKHDDAKAAESDNSDSESDGEGSDESSGSANREPRDSDAKSPSGAESEQDSSNSKNSSNEERNSEKDPATEKPKNGESSENSDDPKSASSSDKPAGDQSKPSSNGSPKDGKPSPQGSESNGQPPKPNKSGKPQQGTAQQDQNGKQSKNEDHTPGREQLEEARELMQQALEDLKDQNRDQAIDKQDEAITQLQKAVDKLEEMLKQLREEEKEMVLAAIEARFQRLLALQTQIYESTIDLASTPRKDWLDNAIIQCRELSQQQADLTRECSQTTGLLREDGTSVSILVAVEDIEADMASVALRLQKTKTGSLTQTMETDIIEALNELIEATQKEMQEMKSEERQQQQQQSDQQKKPPLVELMAEIRVLRSLQLRVNRRTTTVHELMQETDADDVEDLNGQLIELTERQNRLGESAAELAKRMESKR